jgi:hypothetical protein
MGQLFYILGHIQKLSAQAPVTAQAILAENPQICYALLHAECLAGMVDRPMLPMSPEEVRKAKSTARQMQEEIADHELPPPAAGQAFAKSAGARPGLNVKSEVGPPVPPPPPPAPPMAAFAKSAMLPPQAPPLGSPGLPGAPMAMSGAAAGTGGAMQGGETPEQKQVLMQKLMELTPEQIAQLPEATKRQVLLFLQQSQG